MTAVEWLINQFNEERHLTEDEFNHIIKKSKEMEKQHIIDAFESGYGAGEHANEQLGSEYYDETFKNNKS